ncbi:DUF3784 domain-containing protein [Oceanobacillus jeddahense]|uniref:DUF3784 domain-containing protein n=1 Tax=Oceanobacillus jeddahense TaxID=1462527 RepID=UPI0005960FC7
MELFLTIIVLVFLFVSSILVYLGKGDFLIAGINMMPKEERKKINMNYLRKYLGKMTFWISVGLLLIAIYEFYYDNKILLFIGLGFIIILTPIVLIKIFNYKSFQK